jgi:hypothetical protein
MNVIDHNQFLTLNKYVLKSIHTLCQCLGYIISLFITQTMQIKSLYITALPCFLWKKPYTLAGFEPRTSFPQVDAMITTGYVRKCFFRTPPFFGAPPSKQQVEKQLLPSSASLGLAVARRLARHRSYGPGLPETKILIWVNFGGTRNGRCWHILWPFGLFYSR